MDFQSGPHCWFRAYPIDDYPAKSRQCAAIMLMIMNNLDPRVAQFPHELVTYGGNGQVFSNWAQVISRACRTTKVSYRRFQFWIVMNYLSVMTEEQTLVMYSGHPMGLFPSHPNAPRVVITNGMVRRSVTIPWIPAKPLLVGDPQLFVEGTLRQVLCARRDHVWADDRWKLLLYRSPRDRPWHYGRFPIRSPYALPDPFGHFRLPSSTPDASTSEPATWRGRSSLLRAWVA